MLRLPVLILSAALSLVASAYAEEREPRVVATIIPIHGLVAGVMEGVGEPSLLVPQNASPHTFSLRPSQAAALRDADVVFLSGPGVEAFMRDMASGLPAETKLVALSEADGVERLPIRKGGAFQEDNDAAGADYDAHTWLDPENAIAMVRAIAVVLSEADTPHAAAFAQNRDRLIASIKTRETEIAARMAPLASRKFILFHDATQYFEHRFGLAAAGSLSVEPDIPPGARRISELRQLIASHQAECVFTEPQFDSRLIGPIVEGSEARVSLIDVEGALIRPGPAAYLDLLRTLSTAFTDCLAAKVP